MGATDLDATRANLRMLDEDVSVANADWRPSASAVGEHKQTFIHPLGAVAGGRAVQNMNTGYTATIEQNIYKGGETVATIGQAESNVSAGKAGLFVQEQKTLFAGVQAHTDIVAKEQILTFQENNKKFNEGFLAQVEAQYEVGEVSRTDVEIVRGTYDQSVAALTSAIGDLESAKAEYLRQTGLTPGALSEGLVLLSVPDAYEEALAIAKQRNPSIVQQRYTLEAAQFNVDIQLAALLPKLGINGSVGNNRFSQSDFFDIRRRTELAAAATLVIPIYLQGKPNAKVRQAYQNVAQQKILLVGVQRQVVENTRVAWETLLVARENVKSILAQVKAFELSVEGAVEEANVGLKTVIDVTIQQQRLVEAQIKLAQFQKSLVDANYQLLVAMGRMTACDMKLKVKYYDPDAYYIEYQKAWIQFWQGDDLRYVKDGDTQ